MLNHIKLRYILFITFTLISCVPVILMGLWVQQSALNKELEAVNEKHLLVARNLTGDLTRYVIDVESSFRLIAKNLSHNHKIEGVREHIKTLNLRYISIINFDGIIKFNVSNAAKKLKKIDYNIMTKIEPLLVKALTETETVFYSNMMLDENKKATFYLIKAIDKSHFAIASLSTKHIIDAQKKVIFGKRGHAAIVDKTGRAIAHPIKEWVQSMKDMSFLPPVKKMMQGKTGVSRFYTPAMKADMVAGYTYVPIVGWGVMIPQPFEELEARASDVKIVIIWITLLGITIAGIIGWILAGVLSRPLQAVVESSRIKSNSHNLSKATTQHCCLPFEYNELLASYNHMVDVIKDKTSIMEDTSNRLSEAQRIAHVGNWEWNIEEDKVWCSDEFYRICGIQAQDFNHNFDSLLNLIHPDDRQMAASILNKVQRRGGRFNLNHKIILDNDGECYVHHEGELHVGETDNKRRIIGIIHDISDRKRYEAELQQQANYDNLTKLPNRTLLIDRLKQETLSSMRNEQTMGLLSIDLDNFKLVNDTYGHIVGDKLLQQAAVRLKSCIRESDTLARLGGDEFCIILCDIQNEEDCSVIANKIISSFNNAFTIDNHESFIGASVGITLYPNDSTDANTLIRNADIALYRVKESEKNNYCFFKEEMDTEVTHRMSLSNDLHKAVEQKEFTLYYQPIIDLQTGKISSAEALIRWIHPQRGFVPPDEFIPLAEHTGIIGPLGEWVMQTACENATTWTDIVSVPPRISVNLSVRQLKLGLSKERVKSIIKASKLPEDQLILEITESLVMHDTDEAIAWMKSIRDIGVSFSIDDFGTGYSSLSYLKKLPINVLKIDRSFINDMMNNVEDASLVNTIISIAKNLNLKIVAEGVEDEQQLNHLNALQCDYIQGYYYSKPLPENEFLEFLSNWDETKTLLKINPKEA
ncbi:diguanylate cyclase/phosphodiesterase (GGDEF & EAL domains) with PAS/PAC sensor(s) [hydrothermal vent metagenome]|uniref:Diguanylate cyclase/phosphodiesterase (GGDEF & EAL domains) with PAS/PAC sensor(S) n=1 Tax=hydrothermal vent metagenome TaxID=652676 RepID=A0A3B0ZFK0_9ZZZZ